MTDGIKYSEEVHSVTCAGKTILVRNLTPVYTEQKCGKVKANISGELYSVFSKYFQPFEHVQSEGADNDRNLRKTIR